MKEKTQFALILRINKQIINLANSTLLRELANKYKLLNIAKYYLKSVQKNINNQKLKNNNYKNDLCQKTKQKTIAFSTENIITIWVVLN